MILKKLENFMYSKPLKLRKYHNENVETWTHFIFKAFEDKQFKPGSAEGEISFNI